MEETVDLKNKIAIVTGASAGIGEAIALELAKQGCHLCLCGRNEARLNQVKTACLQNTSSPIKIELVIGDVTHRGVQRQIVEVTVKSFGKLDVLVNNAGVGLMRNLADTKTEDFQRLMRTNVESVFFLTQLAVPHLIRSKGNIVNISSIVSEKASPGYMVYAMTKAAIDSFTKSLALDLAAHKVRVNAVNPASVESMLYLRGKEAMSDEQYKQFKTISGPLHPLGRLVKPSEVADAVVFLASGRANYVTGQTVFVDGGRHLVWAGPKL